MRGRGSPRGVVGALPPTTPPFERAARRLVATAAALAVTVAALLAADAGLAGQPGKWTPITGIEGIGAASTDELGLERTADGVLHVAWTREADALSNTLLHSAIAPNGRSVAGPVTILSTPNTGMNSSVDLLPGPGGGLRVLFSGLFPETVLDEVLATATAPQSGTTWSPPAPLSNTASPSPVYVAAGIGGSVSPAGAVASVWGDSGPGDAGYHLGISPLDPDVHLSPAADEVDPNVAFDTVSGAGFLAWSNLPGSGAGSIVVVPLGGGPATAVPRSGATWIGQRVSIAARAGGGVYVGYGSGGNQGSARPAWWRIGAPQPTVVSGQGGARHTGLASGPGGRMWMFWDRKRKIYAARTNAAATRLGQIVAVTPPRGTRAIHRLNAEGSRGPLDLLALAGAQGRLGYFHQRILPGLTLAARPGAVRRGGKVGFGASDAGRPVKGARVMLRLGRRQLSARTNGRGRATIRVPANTSPRRYTAIARKGGYTPTERTIRVKP